MVLVDTSEDILKKSAKGIEASLKRVAKKKFAEKPEVSLTAPSSSHINLMDNHVLLFINHGSRSLGWRGVRSESPEEHLYKHRCCVHS